MPLLKSTSSQASLPQPFSLRDVEQQASAILARAQQQASALLEAAQVQAERIRADARAQGASEGQVDGRRAGLEQGIAAGRQQALNEHREALKLLIDSLSATSTQLDASRQRLLQAGTDAVIELAVAIARKVAAGFAVASDQTVLENVNAALRYVVGRADVRLAVHPTQKTLLEESLPRIQTQWPNLKHVQIVADESISPGGTYVSTAGGEVDASLEGMIDRIAEQLLGATGSGPSQPATD
jgi:flagellar assembly protein FliH